MPDERLDLILANIEQCRDACPTSAQSVEYPQGALHGEMDWWSSLQDEFPAEFEAALKRESERAHDICMEMGY